jgi:hypothetical protein
MVGYLIRNTKLHPSSLPLRSINSAIGIFGNLKRGEGGAGVVEIQAKPRHIDLRIKKLADGRRAILVDRQGHDLVLWTAQLHLQGRRV